MKEIGKILVYLLCTIILGAVLAPPLYWAGQWVASKGVLVFLAETGFQRFFNRAVLIAAVLLLWPLVKALQVGKIKDLGLQPNRRFRRDFFSGLVISSAFLILMSASLLWTEAYNLKATLPWGYLPKLTLTAVTVSVLEEALFRGALQGLIQRTASTFVSITFVSALFSAVHFLKPKAQSLAIVEWSTGFATIPHVFAKFGDPLQVGAGFLTIFIGGWILGYARVQTKSLWMPIGLHIGWIFFKMGFNKFSERTDALFPWFGTDLFVGLGPVLVLCATGVCVWWWLRRENGVAHPGGC